MTFAGVALARAPRVSFTNLHSGETYEMPLNPETLEEEIGVNWTKKQIIGLSHEPMQYVNTDNFQLPGLEFDFHGYTDGEIEEINNGRRFFHSLCYPPEGVEGSRAGGAPRILLVWPNVVSMTCVLNRIRIRAERFAADGRIMRYRLRVDIEEIRDVRITSESVRAMGVVRTPQQGTE